MLHSVSLMQIPYGRFGVQTHCGSTKLHLKRNCSISQKLDNNRVTVALGHKRHTFKWIDLHANVSEPKKKCRCHEINLYFGT